MTSHILFGLRVVAAIAIIVPLLSAPSLASLALACAAALLAVGALVRWVFLLLIEEAEPIEPAPGHRVAMVTTFVAGAESLSMLERTLAAMVAVSYPHDTWLLDEVGNDDVIDLCRRLSVRHFSRGNRLEYQTEIGPFQRGSKHGNYNAWLDAVGYAGYDVLAAIDPDHVPDAGYLTRTLGQLSDCKIAYVQSPQEYYNLKASFVARGCSEEARDFYWISQRAFHRFRAPSVIGAHGVHKLEALRAVGGFAPHVADDLLLTLRYQMSGWGGAYVARVLARGLAPVDWPTYLKQQRRWARSLLDVKLRLYPRMTRALPLRTRLVGFLQGLSYLQDAAVAIFFAITLFAILIWGVPDSLAEAFATPALLVGGAVLALTGLYPHLYHGPHRNFHFYWHAACLRAVKWPYALLALLDVILRRDQGYGLTAKKDQATTVDWLLYWPHLLAGGAIVGAWMYGVSAGHVRGVWPNMLAAIALFPSLLLVTSGLRRSPPAFDPALMDPPPD